MDIILGNTWIVGQCAKTKIHHHVFHAEHSSQSDGEGQAESEEGAWGDTVVQVSPFVATENTHQSFWFKHRVRGSAAEESEVDPFELRFTQATISGHALLPLKSATLSIQVLGAAGQQSIRVSDQHSNLQSETFTGNLGNHQ